MAKFNRSKLSKYKTSKVSYESRKSKRETAISISRDRDDKNIKHDESTENLVIHNKDKEKYIRYLMKKLDTTDYDSILNIVHTYRTYNNYVFDRDMCSKQSQYYYKRG